MYDPKRASTARKNAPTMTAVPTIVRVFLKTISARLLWYYLLQEWSIVYTKYSKIKHSNQSMDMDDTHA